MGEAWGGDGRPADTGRTEHARQPHRVEPGAGGRAAPEKADAARREGRLDLNVPQVAGSAIAAVVAAKLASNLGVYGTIAGAGVVSALGTCGGSILQHVFRRTGRHVQEVAVQARPGVRPVRQRARSETDRAGRTARTRQAAETEQTRQTEQTFRTRPLRESAPTGTPPPAATAPLTGTGSGTGDGADLAGPRRREGYGEPTSYRAGRLNWKRPVVAVALAFGLTMAGITGYEAIAGENISGHGHGTTIGNAVTGHSSSRSGGSGRAPAHGTSATPSQGATGPHRSDGAGRPRPDTTVPTTQRTGAPSAGTGTGASTGAGTGPADAGAGTDGGTSGTASTPTPASPSPASASPSPSPAATAGGTNTDGAAGGVTP